MGTKRFSFLGFSRNESVGIFLILIAIISLTLVNMQDSLRKSRDTTRKDDVRDVSDAILNWGIDNKSFPPSDEAGRIVACSDGACEWGKDPLTTFFAKGREPYLERLPVDPSSSNGASYYYASTLRRFQIYGALEDDSWDEYDSAIVELGLPCGNKICNFGRASHGVPLDKLLTEYENEIGVDEQSGTAAVVPKEQRDDIDK